MKSFTVALALLVFCPSSFALADPSLRVVGEKSVSSGTKCDYFARELESWWRKILRARHYNPHQTEEIVHAATTASTKSSPITTDEALTQVAAWMDRYETLPSDMGLLDGALSRFYGSKEAEVAAAQQGRIQILKDAVNNRTLIYPITLELPRAPSFDKGLLNLQRGSEALIQLTFRNRKDVEKELAADLKFVAKVEKLRVRREIEQAELYSKIRRFRFMFPKGTYRRLIAVAQTAPESLEPATMVVDPSKVENSMATSATAIIDEEGERTITPSQKAEADQSKDSSFRLLVLLKRAYKIIYDKKEEPYASILRPSDRALKLVDEVTKTDIVNNFVTVPSYVDRAWGWIKPIPDGLGKVQASLLPFQRPILLWGSITVLVTTWGGWLVWTRDNVYAPARDWVVYDESELRAKAYFEMLVKARMEISVPARTIEDFYFGLDRRSGFYKYVQDNFSDEAAKIAFEYLQRIRPELKADPLLDPTLKPERLEGYTREAEEIVRRRDALLFGFKSPVGNISGVEARLAGRQHNYWLVSQIVKKESTDIETGKEGLKSSDGTNKQVELLPPEEQMGPPSPAKEPEEKPAEKALEEAKDQSEEQVPSSPEEQAPPVEQEDGNHWGPFKLNGN